MSWRRFNFRQGPPAWSSGLRPLGRRFAPKPAPCPVVVIDEDEDGDGSDSEVFIIDGAAGKDFPTVSRCQAKKGDGSSDNVINLDEDEEEVSRGDKAGPSTAAARRAGSPVAATPGRASPGNRYGLDYASDSSSESDLCEGWDNISEPDEDCASDCEIMDDSCGTARKMWETAASSRKKTPDGVHKGDEGMAAASTSSSGSETPPGENAEGLFASECRLGEDIFRFFQDAYVAAEYSWKGNMHFYDAWKGEPSSTHAAKDGHDPSTVPDAKECLSGKNVSNGKDTECVQNKHGDAKYSFAECHEGEEVFQYFRHADNEGAQNTTGAAKDGHDPSTVPDAKECLSGKNVSDGKETECVQNRHGDAKYSFAECHEGEEVFQYFRHADDEGAQNTTGAAKDGHDPSTVPDAKECLSGKNVSNGKETECVQNSHGDAKYSFAECHIDEEVFQYFRHADDEGAQNSTGTAKDGCDPSVQNASECSNGNVSNEKRPDSSGSPTLDSYAARNDETTHFHDGAVPGKASDGIQSPHLDQTFVYSFVSTKRVFPASSSPHWKYASPPMYVGTPEKMDERIPEGVCSHKDPSSSDAHNVTSASCSLSQKDLVDDPERSNQFTLVQEASDFPDGLIGEREKHKETAEFKRAAEEEWASRQRQLQIQAEEAKKLRKRKKAEALRLLDMEKKQKQRLEEVRESQKKNEEEILLKEQYRSVVRKELEDTERRYRDTKSILRALGIPVEGCEVRAALKQAQVKFHPDRVSRNNIYQQVKAEETFKFISRLKEKLPRFLL